MPTNPQIRAAPERFGEILNSNQLATLFLYFAQFLRIIGFTEEVAASAFLQDYFGAWCPWSDSAIPDVFQRVALENAKKYDKMCAIFAAEYDPLVNYDRSESEVETRTPNLTTSRADQTAGTDSRTITKNQTEHRADKPVKPEGSQEEWSETTTHSVAPYDSATMSAAEKDVRTEHGWRETETSYTGDGDTDILSRNQAQNSTTTETGTETRARSLAVSGNIGTMSAQNMAEQELALAEKMNIFRIIEKDIAAKLFLQVW